MESRQEIRLGRTAVCWTSFRIWAIEHFALLGFVKE